jgi:uncharacterized protein
VPPRPSPGELFRLAAALYLVLALAGIAWIGWRRGEIPGELFFAPAGWALDLALGLGTASLLLFLWQGLRRLLPLARQLERELAAALGPLRRDEALGLALLSGLAEEVFFRGAVQPAWGYPAATLLFALLHTGRRPAMALWGMLALIAGAALGGLMLWRGNLLAPVVAHVVVNAVQLRRLTSSAGVAAADPVPPPRAGP